MRVLVTGGAGYIGSHACKALSKAGHEPIVYDDLSAGHANAVKWGPLETGNILDGQRLDEVIARHRPQAVMHFAAFAYVADSVTDPSRYYRNNLEGSLSLLRAMLRAGIGMIVFSSTCATYGVPARLPIAEDAPQQPVNPYGFTKFCIEQALRDFSAAYGLRHVALRYFNAAGADPDGDIGERHEPETHAIPLALKAAFGTAPAFRLFGTDYPTPDGSAVRDYVHVSDLASAHIAALGHLLAGGQGGAFNLGTGQGTSVLEMLEAVHAVTGLAVPFIREGRRPGDPPALYASADRAREVLGWQPRVSSIRSIIETAAPWFQP